MTHIEHVEMPRYAADDPQRNVPLRVRYGLNELSVDTFKTELQKREKASSKKQAILLILQMVNNVFGDRARQMVNTRCLDEMRTVYGVIEYANEELRKIGKRYDCRVPQYTRYDTGLGDAQISMS